MKNAKGKDEGGRSETDELWGGGVTNDEGGSGDVEMGEETRDDVKEMKKKWNAKNMPFV